MTDPATGAPHHVHVLPHRAARRRPVRRALGWGGGLVLLPLRLTRRLVAVTFRVGVGVGRAGVGVGTLPVRATAAGARRLGAVGVVALLVGIGVGLLVAPVSGAQLRARLRTLVGGTTARPDGDVERDVRETLSSAPRTWHLPQPEVSAHGGVVTLRGAVPHETARREVEATAATVRGVQGVVNDLVVA